MPFFYVGIHKAERGSEFSKLISPIWPNSLILFLEPLGTKYTHTLTHTHSLSVSGLAFLLGAPVYVQSPCFSVLDFSRLLIHSLLGA